MKKEIRTSTGLIIIFAAAVILIGSALTWGNLNSVDYNDYSGAALLKKPVKKTIDETADWKTYINSKYGFGLTFTDDWKNYTIKETITSNPSNKDPLAYLQISVPSTNNKDVVVVNIFKPDNYEASKKAQDPGPGSLLGKNNEYIFTYVPNNGLNGEPDGTFINSLIPNLAKTFKSVTIDVTADWKTYTNDTYGFSFKYPKEWNVEEKDKEITFRETGKSYQVEATDTYIFGVFVSNNTKNQSAQEVAEERKSKFQGGADDPITEIKISDKTGAQFINYLDTTNYVISGNNVISLVLPNFGSESINKKFKDSFNQILATFQFTK